MQKLTNPKPNRRTFLMLAGAVGSAIGLSRLPSLQAESSYPDLAALRAEHEKSGMISPQKTYRMMEWEFHTPPDELFNINIDGAMHAARDAGAEGVMFYTQDHWGYAYYPSDVAVRHPHLDRNVFGTEVALAHRLGMSASAYYCLQFNNQSVLAHPNWAWVSEKGEPERWMQGPRPSLVHHLS
jgi:hypothetical protein